MVSVLCFVLSVCFFCLFFSFFCLSVCFVLFFLYVGLFVLYFCIFVSYRLSVCLFDSLSVSLSVCLSVCLLCIGRYLWEIRVSPHSLIPKNIWAIFSSLLFGSNKLECRAVVLTIFQFKALKNKSCSGNLLRYIL